MPLIRLPIEKDGLVVPVRVGLPPADHDAIRAAGGVPPAPLVLRGLLDTGADAVLINPSVVAHLQLLPVSRAVNQTVHGSDPVELYWVSLAVTGPDGLTGPTLVRAPHLVVGSPDPLPQQLDLIIGMDILRDCLLIADGPGGTLTIGF